MKIQRLLQLYQQSNRTKRREEKNHKVKNIHYFRAIHSLCSIFQILQLEEKLKQYIVELDNTLSPYVIFLLQIKYIVFHVNKQQKGKYRQTRFLLFCLLLLYGKNIEYVDIFKMSTLKMISIISSIPSLHYMNFIFL